MFFSKLLGNEETRVDLVDTPGAGPSDDMCKTFFSFTQTLPL